MTDRRCMTCDQVTETHGTYWLCKPDFLRHPPPWWATERIRDQQTNVRPDEGIDCPAWKRRTV